MTHLPRGWYVILAALLLTASSCARDEPGTATPPEAEETESLEGLSPEEIRDQAAPMTPEHAESLGIVDTTIHMEEMYPPFDTTIVADTLGVAAGR